MSRIGAEMRHAHHVNAVLLKKDRHPQRQGSSLWWRRPPCEHQLSNAFSTRRRASMVVAWLECDHQRVLLAWLPAWSRAMTSACGCPGWMWRPSPMLCPDSDSTTHPTGGLGRAETKLRPPNLTARSMAMDSETKAAPQEPRGGVWVFVGHGPQALRTSSANRGGSMRYSSGSIELDARPWVRPRRVEV